MYNEVKIFVGGLKVVPQILAVTYYEQIVVKVLSEALHCLTSTHVSTSAYSFMIGNIVWKKSERII